jgi:hypothetical protein
MKKKTSKKTNQAAKKTKPTRKPQKLTAAAVPKTRASSDSCSQTVLACIGRQSGGRDLSGNPALGAVGVQGFLLAGCLNQAFGLTPPDAFSTSDFPSSMKVLDCIDFVCRTVGG